MKTLIFLLFNFAFCLSAQAIVLPPGGPYDTPAVNLKAGEKWAGYTFTLNWTDPKITLNVQILYSVDNKNFSKISCQSTWKGLATNGVSAGAGIVCQAPPNMKFIKARGFVTGGPVDITISKK